MSAPDLVAEFVSHLRESLRDGGFVRVDLSGPLVPAAAVKVIGRFIEIKGQPHLSLTLRHEKRDTVTNLAPEAGCDWVEHRLRTEYRSAMLRTTRRDWQLFCPPGGKARLVPHTPATRQAPPRAHDQARHSWLDASAADWLETLGVSDLSGKPKPSMAGKHHQIHAFLELLAHLARECGWEEPPKPEADNRPLTLVDMGCGKGYLTFASWHLLHRRWNRHVRVMGIEARPELVADANARARNLPAEGLEFAAGTIAQAQLPQMDGLIALHACNTATDDAIRRGVLAGASLIMVAPCCYQHVRPQMQSPELLEPVMRHGIMRERMAEWVTDGLRALALEASGYSARLMEFVASEHTPKNLMLAAIRRPSEDAAAAAREQYVRLKAHFGITSYPLDDLVVPAWQQ